MMNLTVNGVETHVDVEPQMPLLWLLRDELGLMGTKYGCGIAYCGACSVEVDGVATLSCVTPVASVQGKSVRTIEERPDPVVASLQAAWIRHQVPQCGYCQSGMIMAAASLLRRKPAPTDEDIDASINNLCRCGTYQRIRAAIKTAGQSLTGARA